MYKIYAEEMAVTASKLCIYHDAENLESICLPDPKLTMEDNSAGQLTLTMPPANAGYDSVNRLTTTLTVYKDDVEIWSGRVISEDMDFWNQRSLTCEGELAYLNDSIQPPEEYQIESTQCVRQFLEDLIKIHNTQVEPYKQFTVGNVTIEDSNGYLYKYTNYNTTWDCIQEKLLDTYGGHLAIRKSNGVRYLDYWESYPGSSEQKIEFGKNLLDFTKSFDLTDFATVVIPRGEQLEQEIEYDSDGNVISSTETIEALVPYLTVEDIEKGDPDSNEIYTPKYPSSNAKSWQNIYVIDPVAVNNYGWIAVVVDWSDITVADNLFTRAKEYLQDTQFDDLQLEINAVDLHYLGADYESINLLDQVLVLSRPHGLVGDDGLGKEFPVTKLDIPLNDPENATFTFGDKISTSLSSTTRSSNSDILARISNMRFPDIASEAQDLLKEAIDEAYKNADSLIKTALTGALSGYITIVYTDDGTDALYISNRKDYKASNQYWIWDMGGLAYYDETVSSLPKVAITMDGQIVADFITTGVLTANIITAGTLTDAAGGGYFYLDISNGQLFIGQGNNLSNSISAHTSGNTRNPVAMIGPWTITMSSMYYGGSTISSTTSPTVYFGEEGMNLYYSSSAYVRINNGKLTAMGSDITTISDYADSTGRYQYTQMVGGYLKFYYGTSQSDSNNIGGIRSTYWEPNGTSYRGLDISLESNGYVLCLGGVQNSSGTYITPMVINPKGYSLNDSSGKSGYSQNVIVFGTFYANSVTMSDNVQVTLSDNNGWSQSSYSSTIPATLSINIGGAKVSYAGNSDTATKLATSRTISISSSSGSTSASFDGSGDITLYIGSLLPSSSTYTHPDPFSIGTLTVTTAFTVKGTSSANSVDVDLYGTVSIGSNSTNAQNFQCYAVSYFYRNTYLAHQGSSSVYCDGPFNMTSTATSNNYHLTIHSKNDTWWMCLGSRDSDDDTIIGFAYGDTTTDGKIYYFYYAEHSSSGLDSYFCGDTVHLGNTTSTTLIYIGNSNVTSNNIYGQYIYMGYSTHTKYVYIGHTSSDSSLQCYTYIYGKSVYVGYNGYTDNIYIGYSGYTYVYIDGYDISIGDSSSCRYIYIGYNNSSMHSYLYGGEVYVGNCSNCSLVQIGYAASSCTVKIKGSEYNSSDISLKYNIQELSIKSMTPLNIIDNITPISYIFTDGRQHYGYSANEVLDACGGEYGIVIRDDEDGYLMMSYNDFIPLLHLKIKQLESRINELETIIEEED